MRASLHPIPATLLSACLFFCLSTGLAQAAEPQIVQCGFGDKTVSSDLTIIVPDTYPRARIRKAELSVVAGASGERPAVASYVSAKDSPIEIPFIRVAFLMEDPYGFVAQIAQNGDAIAFPFDLDNERPVEGKRHLGSCGNAPALFDLWR